MLDKKDLIIDKVGVCNNIFGLHMVNIECRYKGEKLWCEDTTRKKPIKMWNRMRAIPCPIVWNVNEVRTYPKSVTYRGSTDVNRWEIEFFVFIKYSWMEGEFAWCQDDVSIKIYKEQVKQAPKDLVSNLGSLRIGAIEYMSKKDLGDIKYTMAGNYN